MTLTDLQSMTKAQLNTMSKPQLIAAILGGETEDTTVAAMDGPHGQLRRVVETRTRATAQLVKTRTTTWSYHPNGDVKTIRIVDTDPAGYLINVDDIRHESRESRVGSRESRPDPPLDSPPQADSTLDSTEGA